MTQKPRGMESFIAGFFIGHSFTAQSKYDMKTHSTGISAFIIAGGKSSRFGQDKSLFPYQGKPLIEHVIEAIRPVIERISIIGGGAERFTFLGIPCRGDIIPGLGPIGGVYTALHESETERAFVFACDMPGLNTELIRFMASLSEGFDVTVPAVNGKYEPLHAVYSKSCITHIEKSIRDGNRRTVGFFDRVSVRSVTGDEIRAFADPKTVFRNINYREDVNNC